MSLLDFPRPMGAMPYEPAPARRLVCPDCGGTIPVHIAHELLHVERPLRWLLHEFPECSGLVRFE